MNPCDAHSHPLSCFQSRFTEEETEAQTAPRILPRVSRSASGRVGIETQLEWPTVQALNFDLIHH